MDPIANLKEQRELARHIQRIYEDSAGIGPDEEVWLAEAGYRLSELVLSLDEWRRKGGFDPYEK